MLKKMLKSLFPGQTPVANVEKAGQQIEESPAQAVKQQEVPIIAPHSDSNCCGACNG